MSVVSFKSHDARDFVSRYSGTYGYFERQGSNTSLPVYVEGVHENKLYFQDFSGNKYNVVPDQEDIKFRFQQVRKSLYVGTTGNVYYLERRPARQFQRGVSKHNTNVYKYAKGVGGFLATTVNASCMADIMCGTGKTPFGVVLSPMFAILNDVVFLYNKIIGVRSANELILNQTGEMFVQELRDALRDAKIFYNVVFERK